MAKINMVLDTRKFPYPGHWFKGGHQKRGGLKGKHFLKGVSRRIGGGGVLCLKSSSLPWRLVSIIIWDLFCMILWNEEISYFFLFRVVTISACAQSHPASIALRYVQRRILMSDPNWNKGFYYNGTYPRLGMKHARSAVLFLTTVHVFNFRIDVLLQP